MYKISIETLEQIKKHLERVNGNLHVNEEDDNSTFEDVYHIQCENQRIIRLLEEHFQVK